MSGVVVIIYSIIPSSNYHAYCLIHNYSILMILVTAPAATPQSMPETPKVFQETELWYSEMQQDAIGHCFLWQRESGLSFVLGQCLSARPLSSH